jgi:hypothetical protein
MTAAKLVRYYETVARPITLSNIMRGTAMKNFVAQWKALEEKDKGDTPDVPTITKALPVIKWTEAFRDYLHRCTIGAHTIPLAYVVQNDTSVPPIGAIAADKPHSEEHGSIKDKLIVLATHTHPLYREDNSAVYYLLEEATRATSYAASIKPFQRTRNGRDAWHASQYAGKDKWEAPPYKTVERTKQLHFGQVHCPTPKRVRFDASSIGACHIPTNCQTSTAAWVFS